MIDPYTVRLRHANGDVHGYAYYAHSAENAVDMALLEFPDAELEQDLFWSVTKIITTGN